MGSFNCRFRLITKRWRCTFDCQIFMFKHWSICKCIIYTIHKCIFIWQSNGNIWTFVLYECNIWMLIHVIYDTCNIWMLIYGIYLYKHLYKYVYTLLYKCIFNCLQNIIYLIFLRATTYNKIQLQTTTKQLLPITSLIFKLYYYFKNNRLICKHDLY